MMKANMGCGDDCWGEIRVDVYKGSANVLADIQFLPFRKKVFDDVRSISVLEHIGCWIQGLNELLRVTKTRLILEVPVNSDIRLTDPWRILFPSPKNIRLFLSIPQRARETLWQLNPEIILDYIMKTGFNCKNEKIFQVYAGMPSRCWRITAWRIRD